MYSKDEYNMENEMGKPTFNMLHMRIGQKAFKFSNEPPDFQQRMFYFPACSPLSHRHFVQRFSSFLIPS